MKCQWDSALFGSPLRGFLTRLLTEIFLLDVRDFLFVPAKRKRMEDALLERIQSGGGPFIVVAHSQGSMIAYNVLRELGARDANVRLFVTLGSPLGLQEIQDVLKKWQPRSKLRVPECVDEWLNVADRFDPVALDSDLKDDFAANSRGVRVADVRGFGINREARSNPHSAVGDLKVESVRQTIRETSGSAFASLVTRNVVMRDLINQLEDSEPTWRQPTAF